MKKLLIIIGCFTLFACAGRKKKPPKAVEILVPSSVSTASPYGAEGSVPSQRYVVRMSDGKRDWEVEFPEVATGYEIRIPLEAAEGLSGPQGPDVLWDQSSLTDADRELLKQLRRTQPGMEHEGIFLNGKAAGFAGKTPGTSVSAKTEPAGKTPSAKSVKADETLPAPSRPSYLLGIEQVNQLFKKGSYELAMVRMSSLLRAYPADVRLLSMKGTLWVRMGRPELARTAWEQVLQIEPENPVVLEALRRLNP